MLFDAIKLAFQAIRRNVLRSFLTVLGIVIGVGAVIAMVTIGGGTTAKVKADLAKLGTNLVLVRPGQFGPGGADQGKVQGRDTSRSAVDQRHQGGGPGRAKASPPSTEREPKTTSTAPTTTIYTQDWKLNGR